MAKKIQEQAHDSRPPIVAVLGHVDHGKTTLLDTIRKTHIAEREHGGITQHIGAYQIPGITFIDTPGHEAFAAMRSRGAKIADIALLVVAADDGVMPQTKESIRMITEAEVAMIAVINKIDAPGANVDKVRQDLARNEVQVEGFGGEIPMALVSAKTGKGVDELLIIIQKVAKKLALKNNTKDAFQGDVVETRVDKGKGLVATVIVKQGTLVRNVPLFDGSVEVGKVRALFDDQGKVVEEAEPSKPVEVLGFTKLPLVGTMLTNVIIESETKTADAIPTPLPTLEDFFANATQAKKLAIVVKADTAGSLEAILQALGDTIDIVSSGVGEVSDADVLLAKSTHAFVIGFQVKIRNEIEKLAQTEGVVCRSYTIIYELLEELADVVAGMAEVISRERELGKATILAEFPFDGKRIAGCKVISGRLAKGDQVKLIRGEEEIIKAKIKSIRKGKDETTKVEINAQCGVLFDRLVEFAIGDSIIAFTNS